MTTASRTDNAGDTVSQRTVHRDAKIMTTSIMGASSSSAILVPRRGTTHSVRIAPSTKPVPNTTVSRAERRYAPREATACLQPRAQKGISSPWPTRSGDRKPTARASRCSPTAGGSPGAREGFGATDHGGSRCQGSDLRFRQESRLVGRSLPGRRRKCRREPQQTLVEGQPSDAAHS
jgi:hypothetical protein